MLHQDCYCSPYPHTDWLTLSWPKLLLCQPLHAYHCTGRFKAFPCHPLDIYSPSVIWLTHLQVLSHWFSLTFSPAWSTVSGSLPLYNEGRSVCNQHVSEHIHQSLVQVGILQMEIQHRKWLEKAWVGTKAHRICLHNYNHCHLLVIKDDQVICIGDFVFEGDHCPLVSMSIQQWRHYWNTKWNTMSGTKCHIKGIRSSLLLFLCGYLCCLLPICCLVWIWIIRHFEARCRIASGFLNRSRFPKVGHSSAAKAGLQYLSCHWKPFCLPSRVPGCKGQRNK